MAQLGLRKWGSQFDTIVRIKVRREQVRKEKLTALLNQKLHRAFGLTNSHPVIEDEIESFVLNNKGDFSEIKLKKLRSEIAQKLAPEGITLKIKQKPSRVGSSVAKAAGMGIVGLSENKPEPVHDQLSRGSRHSMSVKSLAMSQSKPQSIRGSQMSRRSTSHRSLAESDEWREIQNFNTLLHLEEQNKEMMQEKQRQKQMKEQLDAQIREKKEKQRQEKEAERLYEDMQRRILKDAEKKEKMKIEAMRRKIEKDKESRDKQIIMENAIRTGTQEREKAQEALLVAKLKKELELEKIAYNEQKNVRKKQMKDMIAENENAQFLMKVTAQKEREEDERIQREIMRKLEEQQNKEANNAKHLKEKQQKFVDKMANDVFSKIEQRQQEEELKIQKYTEEAEMKAKLEDQRRITKLRQDQMRMKDTLARQIKDK